MTELENQAATAAAPKKRFSLIGILSTLLAVASLGIGLAWGTISGKSEQNKAKNQVIITMEPPLVKGEQAKR